MTFDEKRSAALPLTATSFKLRGKTITVEMIEPKIKGDGSNVVVARSPVEIERVGAAADRFRELLSRQGLSFDRILASDRLGKLWDFPAGKSSEITEPTEVRGWYIGAVFRVTGFPFEMTMKTGLNAARNRVTLTDISIELNGDDDPDELALPLARLKRAALTLSGIFGTAYPPNYVEETRNSDGEVIYRFEVGDKVTVEPHRYGYRLTPTTASELIGDGKRIKRDKNDETLRKVAELYRVYSAESGHGFIQRIADDLSLSTNQVKNFLEICRAPSVRLLPPTGRTRKPKAKKRGKK